VIKVTFLGHSCFLIEGKGKSILTDPFISGNPTSPIKPGDVKPDLILLSHGHGDHVGDAVSIAKHSRAEVLGVFELMNYIAKQGVDSNQVHHAHMGCKIQYDFGWVKLVPAFHSSSTNTGEYTGNPVGFVIDFYGHHFYFAGDTGIFGDMELIGRLYKIDTAMLPIGGTFTMDIDDAVEAVKLLKCQTVIPMHYNTFPPIQADPDVFKSRVESETSANVAVLIPGQSLEIPTSEKITVNK
jgi:L-ascorbate metabolism protein UlaG (beta-lactamase superfamily)